eukprot:m.32059 g.32059  ORF g.32059 m.32059 type:complete len:1149 (+) comp31592_c0_seq1:110-3556(+)
MAFSRLHRLAATSYAFFVFVCIASAYNIDVLVPVIKTKGSGTAFSLSLAPFWNKDGPHILVGAPLALSQYIKNVTSSTGSLFKCPLVGSDDNCEEIGHEFMNDSFGLRMDRQLFGQSLATFQSKNDSESRIYSCAPLFRKYYDESVTGGVKSSYFPTGICIQLNGSFELERTDDPCSLAKLTPDLNKEHIMCMGGSSLVASKNRFGVGTIGGFSRRGTIISINEDRSKELVYQRGPYAGVNKYRQDNLPYPELTYYLGYSLTMEPEELVANDDQPVLLSGATRGNGMTGIAHLLRLSNNQNSLVDWKTFDGEQMGESFGHSVCLIDITNNDNNEVITGAPFNSEKNSENQGIVYIYFDLKKRGRATLVPPKRSSNAFFGMAVCSPGDLNKDGYNDLVIGSPGEDDDGTTSGVIYVYFGRDKKAMSSNPPPDQIIRARDSAIFSGIRYFGFTVVPGKDLDENSYPDILIGSFESNKAILLRTRDLVQIEANVTFSTKEVDLDDQSCSEADILKTVSNPTGRNYSCFFVYSSLKFHFKSRNSSQYHTLPLIINVTLDVNHGIEQRLFFAKDTTYSRSKQEQIEMKEDVIITIAHRLYVSPSISDRENPFQVKLEYEEISDFRDVLPTRRDTEHLPTVYPVIEKDGKEFVAENQVLVRLSCDDKDGGDGCNPDLSPTLNISFANNIENLKGADFLIAGEGPLLLLNISVVNKKEEAHQAKVIIHLPPRVTFKNSTTILMDEGEVACELALSYEQDHVGETIVECSIGNPLKRNRETKFLVRLQNSLLGNEDLLQIEMNVTSTGLELGQRDTENHVTANFTVKAISELKLTGTFFFDNKKGKLKYETDASDIVQSPKNLKDLGHSITHRYTVRNFGPSIVSALKLTVWWPVQTIDRRDLLYLHSFVIPGDQDNIQCDAAQYIDRCNYAKGSVSDCVAVFEEFSENSPAEKFSPPPECDEFLCIPIRCSVNRTLIRRGGFQVIINSTAVAKTLQQNFSDVGPLAFSVLQVENVQDYFEKPKVFSTTVLSRLEPEPTIVARDCIPFWVIIASVIGGLLILTVIVLLLYLCGFFKSSSKGQYRVRRQEQWKTVSPSAQTPGPGMYATETDSTAKRSKNGRDIEMETRQTKTRSTGSGGGEPGEDRKPKYLKEEEM